MNFKYVQQQKNGFALLLAIIVSSIVLAIGVSLLQISVNQINLASTARESEIAFQSASAGEECMQYWRYFEPNFTTTATQNVAPSVQCFGASAHSGAKSIRTNFGGTPSTGYTDHFTYEFSLGNKSTDACIQVEMYVMNAFGASITQSFSNAAVGNNGSKTCNVGGTCTVLISTGYNRSCTTLGTDIFSVQRELTLEF